MNYLFSFGTTIWVTCVVATILGCENCKSLDDHRPIARAHVAVDSESTNNSHQSEESGLPRVILSPVDKVYETERRYLALLAEIGKLRLPPDDPRSIDLERLWRQLNLEWDEVLDDMDDRSMWLMDQ